MSLIEQTEVSITRNYRNSQEASFTKVAGSIGEKYVWLYPMQTMMLSNDAPRLGLTFHVDGNHNWIWVNSTVQNVGLKKGDTITFNFIDGCTIDIKFPVGRIKDGKEVMALSTINDQQLMYFFKTALHHISLPSSAGNCNVHFIPEVSRQYKTEKDGQLLVGIMAKRISEAKLAIMYGK